MVAKGIDFAAYLNIDAYYILAKHVEIEVKGVEAAERVGKHTDQSKAEVPAMTGLDVKAALLTSGISTILHVPGHRITH